MSVLSQLEAFDKALEIFRAQPDRPNFRAASRKLRETGLRTDRRTVQTWWRRGRLLAKGRRTSSIEVLLQASPPPPRKIADRSTRPSLPNPSEPPSNRAAVEPNALPSNGAVQLAPDASRAETADARLLKLQQEAADVAVAEARVLRAGRHLAEGILATGTNVLAGLNPIAKQLCERLMREAAAGATDHDVDTTLKRLTYVTKTLTEASAAMEKLVAAQRLLDGAATAIVEHRATQPPDDPATAAARARAAIVAAVDACRTIDVEGRAVSSTDQKDIP